MKRSKIQKRLLLGQLKSLRLYLPFHKTLEYEFYNTLLDSYRNRKLVINYRTGTYKLVGDVGSGTGTGFALIGLSGCGKSSSLKSLTDHYPQVIIHKTDRGEISQILYLTVSCLPNSNFKAMYKSIGKAIDEALHTNIYEDMIEKIRTLGSQQQKIVELIETYAIGMIIFDEIQLMDFSAISESSFESLMTIANQTKIVIAIVGTNDSYDKILKYPRTVRRIGNFIDASLYCQLKNNTAYVLKILSQYQLTDRKIIITDELIEAVHSETKGIISLIISLYIAMQDYYIENDLKCPIDGDYATKIFKRYFPKIRSILQKSDYKSKDVKLSEMIRQSELAYKRQLEELEQRTSSEEMTNNMGETDISDIIDVITKSILDVTEQFTVKQIETAIKQVIGSNKKTDINIRVVTRMVFDKLKESRTVPKISKEEMLKNIID